MDTGIIFMFMLSILFIVIILWNAINNIGDTGQNELREKFSEEYGIVPLPDSIRVYTENEAYPSNKYFLQYPYWLYSKQDGCQDIRRSDNKIIWNDSSLEFQNWRLVSIYPFDLIEIVKVLRQKGYQIEMTPEEKERLQELEEEKKKSSHQLDAAGIYEEFIRNPREFEYFCADLLRSEGWKCTVTQATNDGGYDIEFHRGDETGIAECKCYAVSKNIGRPMIQKLVGANVEHADRMLFMTTASFARTAEEYASLQGVELIDGEKLAEMLNAKSQKKEQTESIPDTYQWQISDMARYVPSDIFIAYFEQSL